MNSIVEDVLEKLRKRDCSLDNNECDYLLGYIEELEQRLKHTRSILDISTKQRDDKIETYEIAHRLQKDYIEQLETNRDEVIEILKDKNVKVVNVAPNVPLLCNEELISTLERGKE